MSKEQNISAVIIGRNEGQRLIMCLKSLVQVVDSIVYVDSGSSDNSIENAKLLGVDVVQLDLTKPFTAARARNEGVAYILKKKLGTKYIQFVDGDCEIRAPWLASAKSFLDNKLDYAVVCGRRRERFPEFSVYNALCDIEWDTPIGDAVACGGDALIRVSAFAQVGGFNSNLIAGEEPEMCFRLRQTGWKIYRMDEEMVLHDAAMSSFSQWWSRAKRAGYAYALSVALHGSSKEKFRVKELKSIVVWGGLIPFLTIILSFFHFTAILLMLFYPIQLVRLFIKFKNLAIPMKIRFYYALSTLVAKFPQLLGIISFMVDKKQGGLVRLIEYK